MDDYLRLINRADLIIVDEFGYPLMEKSPQLHLPCFMPSFPLATKKGTIITTNRSVTDWPRYLGNDKILAAQFLTASCTTQYVYVLRAKVTGRGI